MVANTLLYLYSMDQESIPFRNIKPTVWLKSGGGCWSLNVWVMMHYLLK